MASAPVSTTPSADAGPDELVAEIEQVRERLAGTVDALVDRANPKNIAKRALNDVKSRFVTSDGEPRLETIIPVAGGVVAVIALIVVIRKLVND